MNEMRFVSGFMFCFIVFSPVFVSLFLQLAWICAQQRQNLNSLILSRPDTGPSVCCQKANLLENTKFVDAHKAKGIKYQVKKCENYKSVYFHFTCEMEID